MHGMWCRLWSVFGQFRWGVPRLSCVFACMRTACKKSFFCVMIWRDIDFWFTCMVVCLTMDIWMCCMARVIFLFGYLWWSWWYRWLWFRCNRVYVDMHGLWCRLWSVFGQFRWGVPRLSCVFACMRTACKKSFFCVMIWRDIDFWFTCMVVCLTMDIWMCCMVCDFLMVGNNY